MFTPAWLIITWLIFLSFTGPSAFVSTNTDTIVQNDNASFKSSKLEVSFFGIEAGMYF